MKLDTGTELPDKFILTDEFKEFCKLINDTSVNLFITGKAGSGKSTLLEYFRQNTDKNIVTLAHQGITAIKAKGQTIHGFFKFGPHFISQQDIKILIGDKKEVLQNLDTILIDEISMVRADLFDAINLSLKKNRKNNKPFGGVQIILFGDVMQIDPIVSSVEKEIMEKFYPNGRFFFNSNIYKEGNFKQIELTKIFRQSDDTFINLLNKIRINKATNSDLTILNKRIVTYDNVLEGTIVLAPTNRKVDDINNTNLYKLKTSTYNYNAIVKGTWKEKEYPVKKEIILKEGAQIMITKNDTDEPKKWVNGTLAEIYSLSKNKIQIKIKDKIFYLGKTKWDKYVHQFLGNKISRKSVGSFIQFPLKLAWAVTIHKSQGQTFDNVAIDLDTGSFAHGQAYVALSRSKTLDGISLLKKINEKDIIFDPLVLKYIGQKLEKKYIKEIMINNKISKEKKIKKPKSNSSESGWTTSDDNKLLAMYKRNIPEIALSKIFKKNISEIRKRIFFLMKNK